MRTLGTVLLIFVLAWLGVAVLLPLVGLAFAIAIPLGGLVIWILPILIIAASDRTSGLEKVAWILAIVFLSWFAWIFYMLLAPISGRRGYARRDDDYRSPYRHSRHY